jgi:hypothetical protein
MINWLSTTAVIGVDADRLAYRLKIDRADIGMYLMEMEDSDFSDWGQWVERIGRNRWVIFGVERDNQSTGGFLALDMAKKNVHLEEYGVTGWKNEALEGMQTDGKPTRIKNAAIPSFARPSKKEDAEDSAHRVNSRFAVEVVEDVVPVGEKIRLCPGCRVKPRPPKKDGTGLRKYCDGCKARKNREDRRKMNGKD